MGELSSTLEESAVPCCKHDKHNDVSPGLVLVFTAGKPQALAFPLSDGPNELGRTIPGLATDPRISRRHAAVTVDGSRMWVTDLGSQNGTFVDGKRLNGQQPCELRRVLRLGDSLLLMKRDVGPMHELGVKIVDGYVLGPAMQNLLNETALMARSDSALFISGESGTGKEVLARSFHNSRPSSSGRFVPVNCATIPNGLAERLLFGTHRGAYSGADKDAEGYVQAANGGTLFLDEIGDLSLDIQAKLLRCLETKEYFPLGASRPARSDFRVCSATNKDLRSLVVRGDFREDLFYRIGKPTLSVPPLRSRPEEIPALIASLVEKTAPSCLVHTSLIEVCLSQPWPGNVRELLTEVRIAAQRAQAAGCPRVEDRHLAATAGMALTSDSHRTPARHDLSDAQHSQAATQEREQILRALHQHRGNVAQAARSLGIPRTHMYRLFAKYGIDSKRLSDRIGCVEGADE